MFKNPQPITKDTDLNLKILASNDLSFCAGQSSALLGLSEVIPCSKELPVLFAKFETDCLPITLLGLPEEGNVTIAAGKAIYEYTPAVFKVYPFLLMADTTDENNFIIGLERDSPLLSEDEGIPLFTEEGESAPLLKQAKDMLETIHVDQKRALEFGKIIQETDLLQPFAVTVTNDDKSTTMPFEGLFYVDEEKLNTLPDQDFLKLRETGLLPIIYAHLISLGRINRIIPTEAPKEEGPQQ